MTYVMIIMGWMSGYAYGAMASTQEFNSQATCLAAKSQLEETDLKLWSNKQHIYVFCVPK